MSQMSENLNEWQIWFLQFGICLVGLWKLYRTQFIVHSILLKYIQSKCKLREAWVGRQEFHVLRQLIISLEPHGLQRHSDTTLGKVVGCREDPWIAVRFIEDCHRLEHILGFLQILLSLWQLSSTLLRNLLVFLIECFVVWNSSKLYFLEKFEPTSIPFLLSLFECPLQCSCLDKHQKHNIESSIVE